MLPRLLAYSTALLAAILVAGAQTIPLPAARFTWARGYENQRIPDLGNGYFLNPILAGDHPDPSILKDGVNYFMIHSSGDYYPGLVLWYSRDLASWGPIAPALFQNVGSVQEPDLVKIGDRFYIYFSAIKDGSSSGYVIWSDKIDGSWSEPIALHLACKNPAHLTVENGDRMLLLDGMMLVPLARDGLSIVGKAKKIALAESTKALPLEHVKILRKEKYFYMIGSAKGQILSRRSAQPEGPWEASPHDPLVSASTERDEWSAKRGGQIVDGADGGQFVVYDGREKGFFTLGRQTVMQPIEWLGDGWPIHRFNGHDISRPIRKSGNAPIAQGQPFSDDFSTDKIGRQWSFFQGAASESVRCRRDHKTLLMAANGSSLVESRPLCFITGDRAYEIEAEVEIDGDATAGLVVLANSKSFAGIALSKQGIVVYSRAAASPGQKNLDSTRVVRLRLTNRKSIVRLAFSNDGKWWETIGPDIDISTSEKAGEFIEGFRPGLFSAGSGQARFRDFKYRALAN